jgi:hypothetical protein
MLILRLLADGAIIQAWNAIAKGELLILLNVVGIYFPQSKEAPMAMFTILSEAFTTCIGCQPIQGRGQSG